MESKFTFWAVIILAVALSLGSYYSGLSDGEESGYDKGYEAGHEDGTLEGYDSGWADAREEYAYGSGSWYGPSPADSGTDPYILYADAEEYASDHSDWQWNGEEAYFTADAYIRQKKLGDRIPTKAEFLAAVDFFMNFYEYFLVGEFR